MVLYVILLPHELIKPAVGDNAKSLGVGIYSMVVARSFVVDCDPKTNGGPGAGRAENQVQVSCVKPIHDASLVGS